MSHFAVVVGAGESVVVVVVAAVAAVVAAAVAAAVAVAAAYVTVPLLVVGGASGVAQELMPLMEFSQQWHPTTVLQFVAKPCMEIVEYVGIVAEMRAEPHGTVLFAVLACASVAAAIEVAAAAE
mmetsp:Transcript_6988/g.10211  ORF Transcript_6988/g.10211 Transcript_6988/m.10211 type:complete len:124 (-) Transcript_6988:1078-1449(-)